MNEPTEPSTPAAAAGAAPSPSSTRWARRRFVLGILVRVTLIITGLLLAYYLLPLDEVDNRRLIVMIVLGLILVAAVTARQIRAIIRSEHPGARGVEAMAVAVPLFIVLFATTYYVMAGRDPSAFTQTISRTDSLYFTITVLTTVGFGDIAAVSETARVIVSVQMIADLILIGIVVRSIIAAAREGVRRKSGTAHPVEDELFPDR